MKSTLQTIYDGILNGEQIIVTQNVQAALTEGIPPAEILNDGMIAAMAEVGRLFEAGEYYVPEMLIAARAMQSGGAHPQSPEHVVCQVRPGSIR